MLLLMVILSVHFYGFVTDGIWNSREEVINSKQFQTQYPDYTVNGSDAATEEIFVETGSVNLNIKILMKTVLSQTRIKHGLEMQIPSIFMDSIWT